MLPRGREVELRVRDNKVNLGSVLYCHWHQFPLTQILCGGHLGPASGRDGLCTLHGYRQWGDADLKLHPDHALLKAGEADAATVRSYISLMQKLGMLAGNDVFNTSNLHAMRNCVQRPINVVRLVMRLAIMYVAAKIHMEGTERHPSLTCGGLGKLEIMHIYDLHTLGRILIKSHQGTNFVPFGYLEAECRELDIVRAGVLKVAANEHLVCDLGNSNVARDTGWEGVMLWPSIQNCCFLVYGTHVDHEILRTADVR